MYMYLVALQDAFKTVPLLNSLLPFHSACHRAISHFSSTFQPLQPEKLEPERTGRHTSCPLVDLLSLSARIHNRRDTHTPLHNRSSPQGEVNRLSLTPGCDRDTQ
jgi:hypothetical protein